MKTNLKRKAFALVAATMLLAPGSAMAQSENEYENKADVEPIATSEIVDIKPISAPIELLPHGRVGHITNVTGEWLTVEFGERDSIIMRLWPGVVIIDATTGLPANIAEREHDLVKVYHSARVALSFPPQGTPYVIAINLPEDTYAPHLHTITEVNWINEDTVRLGVRNGELQIYMHRETQLFPHLTRQLVTLEQLTEGTSLLFWYNEITPSIPAYAYPHQAMLMPRSAQQDNDIEFLGGYEDGESQVELIAVTPAMLAVPGAGIMHNGIELFPVRHILEATGFNVGWDADTMTAIVTEPNNFFFGRTILLPVDSLMFYVNDMPHLLPHAITLIDATMHAPAVFFAAL